MKLTLILVISLFALSFAQQNAVSLEKRKQLVNKMQDYLNRRRHGSPSSDLLKDITAYQNSYDGTIEETKEAVEKYIREKGQMYHPEFKNYLRGMIYSESGNFNKMDFRINNIVSLKEHIASFVKENKQMYFIYLKSTVNAEKMVQKIRQVVKKCKKTFIFSRKCWDEYHFVPRPFTPQEMNDIRATMIFKSNQMCKIALGRIDLSK